MPWFDWPNSNTRFVRLTTARAEAINAALDQVSEAFEEISVAVGGVIKAPDAVEPMLLPFASQRSGRLLAFDENGEASVTSYTNSQILDLVGASEIGALGSLAALSFRAKGDSAVNRIAQEKAREWASPEDYYIAGESDWTQAIARALAANAEVRLTPGKEYIVSPQQGLSTPEGGTGICINMTTGKSLVMWGATVRQKAGTVGSAAIISNTAPIADASVIGGYVNGDRSTTGGNQSGVLFFNADRCSIDRVDVFEVRWVGMGFRNLTPGHGGNTIDRGSATGIGYIGVQCKAPDLGVSILGTRVEYTGDNAFDIEGNNPSGDPGYGKMVTISDVHARFCLSGIFLESVGETTISGAFVSDFTGAGVDLNRINSGAKNVIVNGCQIYNAPGLPGIRVNGSSGRMLIGANSFRSLGSSLTATNTAGEIVMLPNMHESISGALVSIPRLANSLVKTRIQEQVYIGARVNGRPFTTSPISNTLNVPARSFAVFASPTCFVEGGGIAATAADEYVGATGNLVTNPDWGAYSIYSTFANPAGETLVYLPSQTPTGAYILINGTLFQIGAFRGLGGAYQVKSLAGADGNFTATTNGAYAWKSYYQEWMTS